MKTIWKFPVMSDVIEMPEGAEILSVQTQHDQPCLWALVDPDAPMERRTFNVVGTGIPFEGDGQFLGTFQLLGGGFIGHVFEPPAVPNSNVLDIQ